MTWDASLATRPIIQPNDMYPQKFVDFPCKISYRGTYMCNFPDIVRYGLESGSRAFVMMSKDPEWIRADSSELRERADIEFVIEPQLAVRDGLRLFETRSGALETPDWISNRYCIYVYQRGTFEPLLSGISPQGRRRANVLGQGGRNDLHVRCPEEHLRSVSVLLRSVGWRCEPHHRRMDANCKGL